MVKKKQPPKTTRNPPTEPPRRGRGRPPGAPERRTLACRLDLPHYARLQALCEAHRCSQRAMIERMIDAQEA